LARKKTSLSVDPVIWREMERACVNKDIERSDVLDGLMRSWLAREAGFTDADAPRLTTEEKKWIDALLFVLRSGDSGPIQAVKSNLDQFVRVVKLAGLHDQGNTGKKLAG
jgi:hypothetical protein